MPHDNNLHSLSPLSIGSTWHKNNRSLSSLSATSDAATFHSAIAHPTMEMSPITSTTSTTTIRNSIRLEDQTLLPEPSSQKMSRQDSGYAAQSEPRISTSSASSRLSKPRRRTTTSSSSRSSRPITQSYSRTSRPVPVSRHTSPPPSSGYQFFQFPPPTLQVDLVEPEVVETLPPPPPPVTQYWTSDSTRRLEYAAIDAASKGLRGFFVRLVPDCILPVEKRRVRFHGGEDEDSDRCSVRRYRLALPPPSEVGDEKDIEARKARPGLLRRWTPFGSTRRTASV